MRTRSATPARQFAVAWAVGSALATAAFGWLVTVGTGDPFRREGVNANFYEAQARAFLHGRLDISPRILNIEAFEHAGRFYTYFPPLPALLRLPIVVVTDRLDGRLTAAFMLVAFVLALSAVGVLVWRLRTLLGGARALGRSETVAVGLLALLMGIGTPLFFTGSRAWVYHEAALWSLGFAVCAYDQIVAYLADPTKRRLARAGGFTTAAILSRVTVGTGPAVALGVVLTISLAGRVAPWAARLARGLGVPESVGRSRAALGGLAATAAAPVACYALVNYAKFGSFFGVPIDRQAQTFIDPNRQRVLAANDGSLFTLRMLPTQALQLLRPDAIRVHGTFPWVGVPTWRPTVIGNLLLDARQPTVSATAAMPLLLALAVVGAIVVVRRRSLAPLRTCVIGAVVVLPLTFWILYVAQRYTLDAFPPLLLLAAAGFVATAETLARQPRARRVGAIALLAVFVAAGSWTGFAVALEYQRLLAPLITEDARREYVDWQSDAAELLGTAPLTVARGDRLPEPGARGALFVHGRCDALYVSDGYEWHVVERLPMPTDVCEEVVARAR